MKNILSFDIEEYFQVSGLETGVNRADWDNFESRVENSTQIILQVLSKKSVKATFFILGWIAEKHKELIKEIAELGHEIACHGYDHKLIHKMTPGQFADDIKRTNDILESITNLKVQGYRAPSFSISADDIERFDILSKLGITYDSSLFPMKHFRYGKAQSIPLKPFDITSGNRVVIKEFPITVVEFMGKRIPAGGGGYFRLFPNWFLNRNFKKVNDDNRPAIIYLHPWEFDPDQPRISGAGYGNTFRHYLNLNKTKSKLESALDKFEFGTFQDYLESLAQ